jgi:hypothetical protein
MDCVLGNCCDAPWWIRDALLVWWVYGRDAYFRDGVRVLPDKPTRFSTAAAHSGRMAEFLITNHFDKDIFEIELTVEYMDQSGQQIGSYPFSVQGNFALCKVGDTILYKLGYRIPKKATKARVVVHRLKFRDSTEWKP